MTVLEQCSSAKLASIPLASLGAEQIKQSLIDCKNALESSVDQILSANQSDFDSAAAAGTPAPLLDRLLLTEERIKGIVQSLLDIAGQSSPLGRVLQDDVLEKGLHLQRISVPLGVVAIIYEARPNVTVDTAALCLKSGNAVILRGGSLALQSNRILVQILHDAGVRAGLPQHWVQLIDSTNRADTDAILTANGLVDVVIPRGSTGLIKHVMQTATVPVIETGEGNCTIYVHESVQEQIVLPIILNAKTQRPGVCNAVESILVDQKLASTLGSEIMLKLVQNSVKLHVDEELYSLALEREELSQFIQADQIVQASEADWAREYLDLEVSIKTVNGVDEAVDYINTYGTHHSDSILATYDAAIEQFLAQVDSAVVYVNASTRFSDGAEFGLGAEVGISTQKTHVRGPFGADALTSTKYIVRGTGQVRA